MQQLIDCTMLCTHTVKSWAGLWVGGFADSKDGKLRIRVVDVADAAGTTGIGAVLDEIRTNLYGSHLCLLPVCPDNLSWVRMLLGQTRGLLSVPVMAVTRDLKAVALRDLLALGVADFIHASGCHDELRVRIERVLAQARTAQLDALSRTLGTAAHPAQTRVAEARSYRQYGARVGSDADDADGATFTEDANDKTRCDKAVRLYSMGRLVPRASHRVAEMRFPYRQHALAQHQNVAERDSLTASDGLDLEAFAAATAARCALRDEPFKQAKGRVVEGFEKAYLIAALDRYSGNIAQAARAAQKHRRAFWELVRKHHIDLSQYRTPGQAQFGSGK